MKKALSYIIPAIAAFCACIPFIDFRIIAPDDSWFLILTCAMFLGMLILTLKTSVIVKGVALLALINCFFSNAPLLSFNAYVSVVGCCYFYIGATQMDSWEPTFKMLKALLILNMLLMTAQFFTHDQFLNFGLEDVKNFGVVGPHMQEASFIVVLSSLLILKHPGYFIFSIITAVFCNSSWSLCCVALGLWVYFPGRRWRSVASAMFMAFILMAFCTGKINANWNASSGRLNIWADTWRIFKMRFWQGWGIGTFKVIYPGMTNIWSIPWKTAHNCWLQYLFELGMWMFTLISLSVVALWDRIWTTGNRRLMAGFAMISCDMIVHFPTRMIQCVLLIILFLVYCEKEIFRGGEVILMPTGL